MKKITALLKENPHHKTLINGKLILVLGITYTRSNLYQNLGRILTVRSEPEGRMSYRDYYGGYSRGYRRADDQLGAYSDWDRTGGGCCCGGGGYGGGDASLFSDGTLFALLAGAALAFYVLYTTLTAAAAAKRKKRSVSGIVQLEDDEEDPLLQHLGDFLGAGRSHGSLSNSLTQYWLWTPCKV